MDSEVEFKKHLETTKWDCLPNEFIVFDTETTGLTPKTDRIVEIGAILFRKDDYLKTGEVTSFQCFIKQDKPIPADATAINGITDEMVKDGDTEYAALTKFFEFVESRPLFAYNAKFDKDFLLATAKRCDYFDQDFKLEVEDVIPLVSEVFNDLPNRKLVTVAKRIGRQNAGAHRALNDCVMALHVLIHCKQTLMIRDSVAAREMCIELERKTAELQEQLEKNTEKEEENNYAGLIGIGILIISLLLFVAVRK